MKAKLVKVTDDIGVYYVLNGSNLPENYVLSDKNCQAIERGYDLDELANKLFPVDLDDYDGKVKEYDKNEPIKKAYLEGFQKALELMGDKKFSEDDMRKAIEIARKGSMQEQHNGYGMPTGSRFILDNLPSDDIIQSLQQTEWDVEIGMGYVYDGLDEMVQPQYYRQPKLDADGCLILKRI